VGGLDIDISLWYTCSQNRKEHHTSPCGTTSAHGLVNSAVRFITGINTDTRNTSENRHSLRIKTFCV